MRKLRLISLAAVLAVTGSLAAGATAAPAAKKPTCFKAKGKTVASHTRARVFERGNRTYACMRGKRPRLLTRDFDDQYVTSGTTGQIALAGNYVAYAYNLTDVSCKAACPPEFDTSQDSLTLLNLVSGREQQVTENYDGEPFALTETGAVGWIMRGEAPRRLMVLFMGNVTQQDQGNLQEGSVEASRSRLTWLRDGQVAGAFFG
jgi:hypothetical protein